VSRPRRLILAILLASACALAAAAPVLARAQRPQNPPDDQYTPLIQRTLGPPHWFRGSDGSYRLVYELELTNGLPLPVQVKRVAVRDAKSGKVLQSLAGKQLEASMSPLGNGGTPTTEVAPGSVDVVYFEVPLRSPRQIPVAVEHTLTIGLPPNPALPQTTQETGGRARVDRRGPIEVAPPIAGDGWVAVGSCCDGPHRRAIQPVNGRLVLGQRFAIDWNQMDAAGQFVVGDPTVNSNWVQYGKPVMAVAAGTVVAAVDKYQDQTPPNNPTKITLAEADGNHVIIRFGKGLYAGYAHLRPGSVRVHVGQRVVPGQVIGELGNSGSSSGPHLHFQVMDSPSLVFSEGLPFAFSAFTMRGRIPPLSTELEKQINAGDAISVEPFELGRRRDELPLGRDVVSFP
jgi:hypothetical protein